MKQFTLIALTLSAFLAVTISCKSNKTAKTNSVEPTKEVVESAKLVLSNEVLATLDEAAKELSTATAIIQNISLTEQEKLVKPDFLIDLNATKGLTTKSQKIAALAVISIDFLLANVYDMPTDGYLETFARLAAELNHPITKEDKDMPISEQFVKIYNKCKESGEITYFWKYIFAMNDEINYIISRNPEIYANCFTEETYQKFFNRYISCKNAVFTLAKYDEEMAAIVKVYNEINSVTDEEFKAQFGTLEAAKEYWAKRAPIFKSLHDSMLK